MLFFNNTDPKANQWEENRFIWSGQINRSRWSFSPVLSDALQWTTGQNVVYNPALACGWPIRIPCSKTGSNGQITSILFQDEYIDKLLPCLCINPLLQKNPPFPMIISTALTSRPLSLRCVFIFEIFLYLTYIFKRKKTEPECNSVTVEFH
jgi:hypothetical protein